MAQSEEEKKQAELQAQLEKNDVTVADDKAEAMKENILKAKSGGAWLGLGIHEVVVAAVELVQAKTGTMGLKFIVENEDGKSEVSMWLSEAALPYTIENVSRLMVHNAPEDKKDAARNHMSNIVSAKELFDTLTEALQAREKAKKPFVCYLSVREAKDGSTYKNKDGETKVSLERNLLSYKPKETPTQSVVQETGGEVLPKELDIPFN